MDSLDTATSAWITGLIGSRFKAAKHAFSHQDTVYKILGSDELFYLKMSADLSAEHTNLQTLQPLADVPEIVGYRHGTDKDMLLLSALPGKNLAEYINQWPQEDIIKKFAKAVREFHSLPVKSILPGSSDTSVVLHGDMSMPNVIFTEHGFSGFIDVGQMHIGAPDTDLADAIWSIQKNGLDPEYGQKFLDAYGPVIMTEKLEAALSFRYKS